jgi:hypothetical protein
MLRYRFRHTVEVVYNLVVPKTQNLVALVMQVLHAVLIGLSRRLVPMLTTLESDHQTGVQAEEIRDV